MKTIVRAAIGISIAMMLISCTTAYQLTNFSVSDVKMNLADWPSRPKDMAYVLMHKYGQPDEMTETMIVWKTNGKWKSTILHKDEFPHDFPVSHTDFLKQSINYKVPADRLNDLAQFDGSIIVDRTRGTISATCDKEEMNFLTVNLANDIVLGRRTVDQARQYLASAVKKFHAGESDPYLQGIQFVVGNGTEFRDLAFELDNQTISQ